MPSLQKRKIQKRSRQQMRNRLVNSKMQSNDRLQLDEERQKLDKERQKLDKEMRKLEEERKKLDEKVSSEDNNSDSVGGGLKKRANKLSKQKRCQLINKEEVKTLTETDEQIDEIELNNEDLPTLDNEDSVINETQLGGCGFKKNMRPIPRSTVEKEEMRKIINQGLASGEFKLIQDNPTGNPMIVNAQKGGSKPTQHRSVSLRTAVKLLKNYYTKRN